jgi:tetratricopeptide (TPR) repeat protein
VNRDDDAPQSAEPLDARSQGEWIELSGQVRQSLRERAGSQTNDALEAAASREPQSPIAPAYRLWIADNLSHEGRYQDAIQAYDGAIDAATSARPLIIEVDFRRGALNHKAQAAKLGGDTSLAVATYFELAEVAGQRAKASFQAGLLTEGTGDRDRAAELYATAARASPSRRSDDPAELARRAVLRLDDPRQAYHESASRLADEIADAIDRRGSARLEELISTTQFSAGPMGGHTTFEEPELLEALMQDFRDSAVVARRGLRGSGNKMYLLTSGWRGRWFEGDVAFILHRAPTGWLWTGVGLSVPNDLWRDRWRPAIPATNQPLPFELLAPWPADVSFAAGGLDKYAITYALGPIAWAWASRSRCGFGVRGFYYNQGSTHSGQNAFAIDFTRHRRYVPFLEESEGTPVLAARAGIVGQVEAGELSGSWSQANEVEIWHADPAKPMDAHRFVSRYLHLEGPFKVPVYPGMHVVAGNRLGTMDDTGNSVLDHLHFSIHDRDTGFASIRPTPLSGVTLGDGDSGKCVLSTNIEYMGDHPVKEATSLLSQHWVITPTAIAGNETVPPIQDQKFLLVLTGVAVIDLKGVSNAQWLEETFSIRPSLTEPLGFAIAKYGITRPPGDEGLTYWTGFEVEQWAPLAGPSSMFNKGQSIDSGFAVNEWRLNPFMTGTNAITGAPLGNMLAGMQVDVGVRDTDAWLHRVNYQITAVGRIAFGGVVIT